jgi:hypothetical protein
MYYEDAYLEGYYDAILESDYDYEEDDYEDAYLEGYYDALLEISEPVKGYRKQLRKDMLKRNNTKKEWEDLLGDKREAKKMALSDYRSDRNIAKQNARRQMEIDRIKKDPGAEGRRILGW